MVREIFFWILLICNFINLIHIGLFTVGANLYDICGFRRSYKEVKQPKKSLVPKPLVSVVIAAYNESLNIGRTLDSVRASHYPNTEVVVVNDGSKDTTEDVVRNYIRRLPQYKTESYMRRSLTTMRLERRFAHVPAEGPRMVLVNQRNRGKGAALNNGIGNHARGEYVMTLDADSMLSPSAIGNAIKHYDDPKVIGVAANVRVVNSPGMVGTLQKFEHMVGYRSKEFFTMANCEFVVGGVASTYRTDLLKQANLYDTDTVTEDIGLSLKMVSQYGNKDMRIIYGSDVVAMTEGVQNFKTLFRQRYRWKLGSLQNLIKYRHLLANRDAKYSRWLTLYRLPMAVFGELLLLIEPITLGYVLWLCLHYHTLAIVFGAYLTITAYVLWTVWPDACLTNKEKIKMSLQALYLYLLFYVMDAVQVSAIFRCLAHPGKLIHLKEHQTWVPPTRAGVIAQAAVA